MLLGQHLFHAIPVKSVGAYNMTQWTQFIALRPAVVMIDLQGKPHLIRKREELSNIDQQEQMPDYLKEFKLWSSRKSQVVSHKQKDLTIGFFNFWKL